MRLLLAAICIAGIAAWRVAAMHGRAQLPAQAVPRIGSIDTRIIAEGSGIVASRRYPGIYWTHSDSGNAAAIYAIARDGRMVATFPVDARNTDWEDIAADDAGRLYIADTGDNSHRRQVVEVLRLEEPDPHGGQFLLRPSCRWRITFPDGPQNCEAMFLRRGEGYLISKTSGEGPSSLYRFALDEGRESVMPTKVALLLTHWPVTACDISPEGDRIAVLSVQEVCFFNFDDLCRLGTDPPVTIPLVVPNRLEGCCFAPDGLVATTENGEIYLFPDVTRVQDRRMAVLTSGLGKPNKRRP